jgi:hypothetical protein
MAVLMFATAGTTVVPLAAAGSSNGARGTVTRGPITPVCRAGISCTAPAVGVTLVFVQAGTPVAAVTTSGQGTYRVVLPPGRYVVRGRGTTRLGSIRPSIVTVRTGTFTVLNFSIDTGIR